MDKVTITRVRDDMFIVEWEFTNGWKDTQRCASEEQARTFAEGFMRGVNAVKNMIGTGPRFDGRISEVSKA